MVNWPSANTHCRYITYRDLNGWGTPSKTVIRIIKAEASDLLRKPALKKRRFTLFLNLNLDKSYTKTNSA